MTDVGGEPAETPMVRSLPLPRILLSAFAAIVCCAAALPVPAAESVDVAAEHEAAAAAAEFMLDLELSAQSGTSLEVTEAARAADGPALLSGLLAAGVEVPDLSRVLLTGEPALVAGSSAESDVAAAFYGTAADQLAEIADGMAEESANSLPGGSGASFPIEATVGGAIVLALMIAVLIGYRKRATSMEALTLVDPLTGLANRRSLDQDLARFDSERVAARQPVSVAMVDVDHFKHFNDSFGHGEGDIALRHVSTTIAAAIRPIDSVYRYGGEEFLVLLRNATPQAAANVCEAIRLAVAGLPIGVTVSVGVATGNEEPLPTLTLAADEALYKAKADGRNRVVLTSVVNRVGARVSGL